MENLKGLFWSIIGIVLVLSLLYGIYYGFKTWSYWLLYESMVIDTIRETVSHSSLMK